MTVEGEGSPLALHWGHQKVGVVVVVARGVGASVAGGRGRRCA